MDESELDPITPTTACVMWQEALNWIAFRHFAGWALGAQPAAFFSIDDSIDRILTEPDGKERLACELLIAKASQSKIRVTAGSSSDDSILVIPSTSFETCCFEVDREPYFYSKNDDDEYYTNLAVVVEDLKREFPGYEPEQDHLVYQRVRPDLDVRPAQPDTNGQRPSQPRAIGRTRRRGRRPQYDWQIFAAEMVSRAIAAPPTSQADFEREMLEWCLETWGREPSESQVREWVAPAFKALQKSHREAGAPQGERRSSLEQTSVKPADHSETPEENASAERARSAEVRDALYRSGLGARKGVAR
jgi:hypothetical protein